jgi:ketosteroid isomerase-like protein
LDADAAEGCRDRSSQRRLSSAVGDLVHTRAGVSPRCGRSAVGQEEVRDLFRNIADTFSNCTSYIYEIVAADVVGDMAFTAGYERTQASINGKPRRYVLRVTQVYRREDGDWKVAHRHGDAAPDSEEVVSELRSTAD